MKKKFKTRSLQSAIVACTLIASGCELLGPDVNVKIPLKGAAVDSSVKSTATDVNFTQLKNQDDKKPLEKVKSEQFKGTGRFVDANINPQSTEKAPEGKFSLNFDDADLGEVAKIILSDMLGENYVLNPAIAGKVTLQTTQPLTKSELMPTLEMLLRMNDVALVKSDGVYRIEPNAKAMQASGVPTIGKSGKSLMPGYQTKIVPLQYVGALDMMDILTPLVPEKAVVRSDPARNIIMVSGSSSEVERMLEIIKTFDVNYMSGLSFGLYPLENVDLTETITQLEQIFNKEEKMPLAGMIKFVPIKHLNAVLIVSQQAQYIEEAKSWVERLDKPSPTSADGGVVVYRVQHVVATELADTLSSIFTGTSTSPTTPKPATPSTAPGAQTATLTNKSTTTNQTTQVTKKSVAGQTNPDSEFAGAQVIADPANNALIISAKPQQLRLIRKIIQQLDVMPLQVLVDATIVAVKLTDDLQYGIKWLFDNQINGDYNGRGGLASGLTGDLVTTSAAVLSGGFSYGFLTNNGAPRMMLNALAKKGKINVLSSPSLMVLNNHEASIHVGDKVPFQSGVNTAGTSSLAGGTVALATTQQIETGVTLKVTPRVNANGIVIMDIDQKVDDALKPPTGQTTTTPTILQRQIVSSVAVVSGETVILGGLISENNSGENDGIPLLKEIPGLGNLFSNTSKSKVRDELVVLITPRVVENKYDARKVTDEFKRNLNGLYYDLPKQKDKTSSLLPALNK